MGSLSPRAQNNNIPTTPGIYAIVNIHNDKRYIGSAVNLRRRRWQHFYALAKGQHKNRHLQSAYDQYGPDAFLYVVVEDIELKENLICREQYYIDLLRPEYNLSPTAASTLGTKYSEASRKKLSIARNSWTLSPESIAKGVATRTGRKMPKEFGEAISARQTGKRYSEKSRAKMSAARKGKPRPEEEVKKSATSRTGLKRDPEAIAKTATKNTGQKRTPEQCQRMSEAQKNRAPVSSETRARISASGMGRVPTEEARRNMSNAQRKNKAQISDETRQRMSDAAKNRRKLKE